MTGCIARDNDDNDACIMYEYSHRTIQFRL